MVCGAKSIGLRGEKLSVMQRRGIFHAAKGLQKDRGRHKRDVKKCISRSFIAHATMFCAIFLAFSDDAERNLMHKTWLLCMAHFYFTSFALQKQKRQS